MELIGVQLDIAWEDRQANCAKVQSLLEQAKPSRGAIVALPEMFNSGFSMNVNRIVETPNGETEQFLRKLAKEFGVYLVAGLAVRENADAPATNQAVVFAPEGHLAGRYSKIHPYAPGKEKEHFLGGEQVQVIDVPPSPRPSPGVPGEGERAGKALARMAPFVCYDLRFPEIFRAGMQRGANVFVVIANWPTPRVEHWVTLLRARAIENQAYVLGVNRCGNDPTLAYPGRSLIVDYRGNVLADAGDRQGVIRADADFDALAKYRTELPFLVDAKRDLSSLF